MINIKMYHFSQFSQNPNKDRELKKKIIVYYTKFLLSILRARVSQNSNRDIEIELKEKKNYSIYTVIYQLQRS
jgi:hypothetical protein